MNLKMLYVKFSDGTVWKIPASLIAEQRANYYADIDASNPSPEWNTAWANEFDIGMKYENMLLDWAKNNTNWEDVSSYAKRIIEPQPADYEKEWSNAAMMVRTGAYQDDLHVRVR
jgi:hypothetical protein